MADVRPFRGVRFDAAHADPALTIAPPYDVISAEQQTALYERSPYNIVRVEYGTGRAGDTDSDNRYTRARDDLREWQRAGVLVRDTAPALYAYRQRFEWDGVRHERSHFFAAVRLEEWDKGVIKPHEHTLSGPKADRLELLRTTRTQVSPVYCLYRAQTGAPPMPRLSGELLYSVETDGQHHELTAVVDAAQQEAVRAHLAACDVYIADGHHRYETALRYRDECHARVGGWTGGEPENFVLMALTEADDPGLVVLPTHRLVNPPSQPRDAMAQISRHFAADEATGVDEALARLRVAQPETAFVAIGLEPGRVHLLTLRDRTGVEALMPSEQPAAWKRLDVSVLQYAVLREVFGIDDAALAAGGAVTYIQDPRDAAAAVAAGDAKLAFLLNATPVDQVLAVSDGGGRMPQKSTYFYPKLPTGLVMNQLS
jgi:uncharacterized protein (DUF1015 family)